MTNQKSAPNPRTPEKKRKQGGAWRLAIALIVVIGAAATAWGVVSRVAASSQESRVAFYTVQRGDLLISILEGGSIQAANSAIIQSQVSGNRTILSIVPEGYAVTHEDVQNGKVLVELDTSDLVERVAQQEISYQSAKASWTDAQESLSIRENQNESDIQRGEMELRFALMDIRKFLGQELANRVLGEHEEGTSDVFALVEDEKLGGEALQQIRRRQADIDLADEELQRAVDRLNWTQELYDAKQVSRNDLEADELALKRRDNALEEARTAYELYLQYDFPRQVERLLADVVEKGRELERIKARARSEISKAEGNLLSQEASYLLQRRRREEYQEDLDNCIIRATRPGLVVYASSVAQRWRGDPIEAGTQVRQGQDLITLPDVSEMAVTVRVHEAFADRVRVGQRALVTTDAFPDRVLEGRVSRVAVLPDPQSRWMSTGVNVYSTRVLIEGDHSETLRPGMSSRVEIIVEELEDVLYIPIQAVTYSGSDRICYVATPVGHEMRTIKTGLFNERFIEVTEGLSEGERVLLYPPGPEGGDGVPGRERPAERQNDLREREEADGNGTQAAIPPPGESPPGGDAPGAAEGARPRGRRGEGGGQRRPPAPQE